MSKVCGYLTEVALVQSFTGRGQYHGAVSIMLQNLPIVLLFMFPEYHYAENLQNN